MSSRAWSSILMRQWSARNGYWLQEQINVGQKIVFFREATMSNPTLRFNGQLLEPYDVQRTENGWHLYYTPGTTIPANPTTWPEQLRGQGWRQVRCGVEPDGSVLVIVERL